MENQKIIESIVQGMIYYSKFLAIPHHMEHYDDGMCAWISPKEGAEGASVVYKVCFGDKSDKAICQIIESYRGKGIPNMLFLTPLSTPKHIRNLLTSIGVEVSGGAHCMALPLEKMAIDHWKDKKSSILVKRVDSKEQFYSWANLINDVLFDCIILDPEQYYPLCEDGKIICFLGYSDGEPVAASALLNEKGNAMLEFIATKPEYRRKGFGTAVCKAAIEKMLDDGAHFISLRGTPEGLFLYESLGFIKYFDF